MKQLVVTTVTALIDEQDLSWRCCWASWEEGFTKNCFVTCRSWKHECHVWLLWSMWNNLYQADVRLDVHVALTYNTKSSHSWQKQDQALTGSQYPNRPDPSCPKSWNDWVPDTGSSFGRHYLLCEWRLDGVTTTEIIFLTWYWNIYTFTSHNVIWLNAFF